MTKIKDLEPGDMFDIVPVLEKLDVEPDAINHEQLFTVEEVWQEQPGVTVVCSTEDGNWALPSDWELLVTL